MNTEQNLLKVGDKVYCKNYNTYGKGYSYRVGEVVRVTKTRAVLNNGIHLINEATRNIVHSNEPYFPQYGNKYAKWYIVTPDVALDIENKKTEANLKNWWYRKMNDFTIDEIARIKDLLDK